jgi:UDP-N-acetylglucosamine enolpyruvyl transferase
VHAQLVQDVHHVGALGVHAHVQPLGDLLVGQALCEGLQHLNLTSGELPDPRAGLALLLAALSCQPKHLAQLLR